MRPFHPLPELHQKALLEIGGKEVIRYFDEESYTLSDLRKSFEEQSFILILKIFQRPKLFSRKIMVDLILHIGLKDYNKSLKRIIGYEKGVARKVHLSLQFTTVFISQDVMQKHQLNSGDKALEKGHRLSKINIIKAEVSSPWGDQAD